MHSWTLEGEILNRGTKDAFEVLLDDSSAPKYINFLTCHGKSRKLRLKGIVVFFWTLLDNLNCNIRTQQIRFPKKTFINLFIFTKRHIKGKRLIKMAFEKTTSPLTLDDRRSASLLSIIFTEIRSSKRNQITIKLARCIDWNLRYTVPLFYLNSRTGDEFFWRQ